MSKAVNTELAIENWLKGLETYKSTTKKRRADDTEDEVYNCTGMASPPRSASPAKRQRIDDDDNNNNNNNNDYDPDFQTPRPTRTASSAGYSLSERSSTSTSRRSGRSSPVKRETALRQALDLPLRRKTLQDLAEEMHRLPGLADLVERLSQCRDKEQILPRVLEDHFRSHATIGDPIRDWMFTRENMSGTGGNEQLRHHYYVYERIQQICRASRECSDAAHPVHEVEWNDKVHSAILELALSSPPLSAPSSSAAATHPLVYHNITGVRTSQRFHDSSNPALKEDRVDYGIFLAPPVNSDLGRHIAAHQARQRNQGAQLEPQLHALHAFEPDRPLAVTIETKRSRGGDALAPSQLANAARAHFRAVQEALVTFCDSNKEKNYGDDLVHPLIELNGSTWHVSFALREGNSLAVYSGVRLGSTESPTDCYALLGSLTYLVQWVRDECWAWWLERIRNAVS